MNKPLFDLHPCFELVGQHELLLLTRDVWMFLVLALHRGGAGAGVVAAGDGSDGEGGRDGGGDGGGDGGKDSSSSSSSSSGYSLMPWSFTQNPNWLADYRQLHSGNSTCAVSAGSFLRLQRAGCGHYACRVPALQQLWRM